MAVKKEGERPDVDRCPADRKTYDRALSASHREAFATLCGALVTALWFWGAVLLLKDSDITLFAMPLWFAASCIGGYLVSVIAVWILVTRCFEDIDLDAAARGADIAAQKETH